MGRGEDAPDHVNSCHHRMLYIDMKFLMTSKKNVLLLVCMSSLVLSLFQSALDYWIVGMRLKHEAWYCMFCAMNDCITVLHV